MTQSTPFSAGQPLDNGELLDALAADGLVSHADAKRLRYTPRNRAEGGRHPIEFLAAQNLPDPRHPGRVLAVDALLTTAELGGYTLFLQRGDDVFHG